MCDHNCTPGVDCAHDRETDTWVGGLTSTDSHRPAMETRAQAVQAPTEGSGPERPAERDHGPSLTVAAFQAAMRRDGGSR